MYEQLKIWLRGEHNSIRYKYTVLPREWLEYIFLYRMSGKSWIDFYANRLNRSQKLSIDADIEYSYKMYGQLHLDFMISHGLKPHHALLDYGCGVCRSGIFFAKYLEPNKYMGVDISEDRLSRGKRLMKDEGIANNTFNIKLVRDCRLQELEGLTFDYIFANSVLTHMPERDIRTTLISLRSLLAPLGAFYFSYAEANERKRRNIKDFWYRQDEIRKFCEDAGYDFAIMDDWPKKGDVMGRASIRPHKELSNGG